MSERTIVVTTIFAPSKALQSVVRLGGYELIVIGDKKTPKAWHLDGASFISWDDQRFTNSRLARSTPYNHYSRKNLGYLLAIGNGATVIIDLDDDNIPLPDYGFPNFHFNGSTTAAELGFINIYKEFTHKKIWPRGLPPRKILDVDIELELRDQNSQIGVWQGLANGDPDVDAIYRLTDNSPCSFVDRDPIALSPGTWTPFNSQNTAFRRELFPLLYLPISVSFRFTDILRSLVAQPIIWSQGYRVGFTKATVFQERNPHNFLHDLVSEFPMYETSERIPEILMGSISPGDSVLTGLFKAYETLLKNKIVTVDEMAALQIWTEECSSLGFD